ncbi:Hypothetical Protein RRSL_02081 [Ralstonia solanacearum UW551]|uniref:Uncharacterized protein n=1 Tax=Ralstonia solanacearum (strain UW551) TaxID=342110 RepID=A0AB33VFX7_RALSU|nr:Hypothetical Protein RRSL_02081 [Ralstonia solanacearum UW551]
MVHPRWHRWWACRRGDYQRRARTRTGTRRGCRGIVPARNSHAASRIASVFAVSRPMATMRAAARACDCNVGGVLLGRCMAVSCDRPSIDGRTHAKRNPDAQKN